MKTFCLLFALKQEADLLLQSGGWSTPRSFHSILPIMLSTYTDPKRSLKCILVFTDNKNNQSFFGTHFASLVSLTCIELFQPDCLINCGIAGGVSQLGASISDVYLAYPFFYSPVYQHHPPPLTLIQKKFSASSLIPSISRTLQLSYSSFCSTDTLHVSSQELSFLQGHNILVRDMESIAIASVCSLYSLPFFSLKVISDLIDTPTSSKNDPFFQLKKVRPYLTKKTIDLIDILSDELSLQTKS